MLLHVLVWFQCKSAAALSLSDKRIHFGFNQGTHSETCSIVWSLCWDGCCGICHEPSEASDFWYYKISKIKGWCAGILQLQKHWSIKVVCQWPKCQLPLLQKCSVCAFHHNLPWVWEPPLMCWWSVYANATQVPSTWTEWLLSQPGQTQGGDVKAPYSSLLAKAWAWIWHFPGSTVSACVVFGIEKWHTSSHASGPLLTWIFSCRQYLQCKHERNSCPD